MYALYEKTHQEGDHWHYKFKREDHLYGRNVGRIPTLLKRSLLPETNEPHKWHINDVPEALAQAGDKNGTLIINLKPNSPKLSLYELREVWGYSDGWTPVMMRLRGLFVDYDPAKVDSQDFVRDISTADDPIFLVTYFQDGSSIANGQLTGKWLPPPPSSTNSVLLWPDVMKYFCEEAARIMQP